ncbi:MAG: hypothetical protein Q9M97_09305 [Candidatus Gracilibacteria bacterium]|nr:hypothetical protein [Candidatus Gracilibacteria bacterium]
MNKLGIEKIKSDENLKNTVYNFMGISISIFSVAIAFIFSETAEIISTVWLFEATILYFFYSQNGSKKIFWAATILFIIGLTKFGILLSEVEKGYYPFLVSFAVILSSFILNLFFINKIKNKSEIHNIHHFLHIIGMGIMGLLLFTNYPK